jgi:hypothetical protein
MLVLAVLAAGCGSQAAGGGDPASRGTTQAADPAVITAAAARRVLSGYAATVSQADRLRQTQLLATAEAGSSYQLDAGSYQFTRVSDPGNRSYEALNVAGSSLYIPQGPGAGQWWAATASWIRPQMPRSAPVPVLLVFTRDAGTWRQILEPDTLGPAPRPLTGPGGHASAVSSSTRSLAMAPEEIPAATASYLNGLAAAGPLCPRPGLCRHVPARKITLTSPGSLSDMHDQAFWAARLPAGSADTDLHTVTQPQDPVYAIRTQGGGALVLYDLRAVLELAPPAGYTFRIAIPGFYSAAVPRTQASLTYADQFAAYDPPSGGGLPSVMADLGGPVSTG